MARTYQFLIGSAEAGLRLDHYLARRLPTSVSRSVIQRVIREGLVLIGGRPVKVHYKLRQGDTITAQFYELPSQGGDATLTAQDIPLEIVYEDASLLVVNKPPGLVTHPAPGHWAGTLVNAILWHLQQDKSSEKMRSAECARPGFHDRRAGGMQNDTKRDSELRTPNSELPLTRAGIVHRLDKDTSGLLLVAKTARVHTALARQLKVRTIRRQYLALVEGSLPLDEGTIDVPIGRHATHRKVMTVRHLGGRSAVTHYRVVRRFAEVSAKQDPAALRYTLLDVSLQTGRTHQIRVHMAHLGHPVVGDVTYGTRPASYWQSLGITRQLLHAYRLSFEHPITKERLTLSAPVPVDMRAWVDEALMKELR